jgi:hypothetical protein
MASGKENTYPEGGSLKEKLRHAFAVGDEYDEKLEEDEEMLLRDIAANIHRRRLSSAAIAFLILNKPFNVIGANFLQMGEVLFTSTPIDTYLKKFIGPNYSHELFVRTMEKRCAVDRLVEILEELADGNS